ncbi:beta-lactamase family protein [Flavobacterium sp. LS1R49]|uniref:Beta-lactamase family protein n=1 Tax=Flavobacterium shii TaxID=2987687 RepID=A0A9X2ZGR2_9FLAO|nr:serine hydrolase domain-containing protein [Flavobacterium shii]MCV9928371.1 beta-lactamase family protein [Flavobacterium shii]
MKKLLFLLTFFTFINFTYSQTDKVDIVIKDLMQKNKIIGLQLAVVKNNKIIKTSYYGLASIQDSIAVDSKTVFSINSMTKAFTGVAIMQLVENGKLKLEDPISKYVDSLPNTWRNITVKQIATHTSGLPDIWERPEHMLSEDSKILFKKIKELPVVFQPGEDLKYNQTNYILLGMIIEKINGKSFEKFLKESQFEKVGMKNTSKAGLGDFYKIVNHAARPYSYFRNGSLTNVYEVIPTNLYPAASIYSTATEIAQWVIALQNNTLLKAETLKTLWTPTLLNNGKKPGEADSTYGTAIGFDTNSRLKNPVITALGGARNALYIYPKDNVSIVILTNLQGGHPQRFIEDIANLYLTEKK